MTGHSAFSWSVSRQVSVHIGQGGEARHARGDLGSHVQQSSVAVYICWIYLQFVFSKLYLRVWIPDVVERDDSATWSCRYWVRSPCSENSRPKNQGSSSRLTPRTQAMLGSSMEDNMLASASKSSLKQIVSRNEPIRVKSSQIKSNWVKSSQTESNWSKMSQI